MKRYLTVGIIFGALVAIIVTISWIAFPAWRDPASGGFLTLLGATAVGVLAFLQGAVSLWKDLKEEKKEDTKPPAPAPMQSVDSQQADSIYNAPGGTINVYPPPITSTETTSEESSFWYTPHPYPMPPNFTGRIAERIMLNQWLNEDNENRLFIIRALGGFGKSALSWHWLTHDINQEVWTKLVWWSFYEGDASFEHFIEETLKYLNLEIHQSKREQVDALLKAMQAQKVLLILDGFERLLRAYSNMNASRQGDFEKKLKDADRDCVSLDTEHFIKSICSMPNLKSKALMTTRLSPRALEQFGQFIQGCHEKELKAMNKKDAIAFMRAQGVQKGTNLEIEDVCKLYGFHPLSLRLVAGHIITNLKNKGDIIVAQNLNASGDVMEHQNHILDVSYNGLPPHQQKLLSTIACFRSSTKFDVLEVIANNKDTLETDLHDLMERGLLQYDNKNEIFDIHPIVRRFAYDQLTAADRTDAHERLVNYFEAIPKPANVKTLEDLAPVIELYHHMVGAGNLDDALKLFIDRLASQLLYQFGAYQLRIELLRVLFLDGEDKPPRLKDESAQAWTLNGLGASYALSGQPYQSVKLRELANDIYENKMMIKQYLAIGLGNMAGQQLVIGALSDAERNLRRAIQLSAETEDKHSLGNWHRELGRLLTTRGMWQDGEENFQKAIEYANELSHFQDQGTAFAYRALRFLLIAREKAIFDTRKSNKEYRQLAIESAQRALELADETTRTRMNVPRDYVRTHWLLGAAYRFSASLRSAQNEPNNEWTPAEENLSKALNLCRQINLVEMEADVLLEIAKLRYNQKNYEEAKNLADEALTITERCGYVLQGADVNLFLAQYALEQEKDKVKAKAYAEEALKLAACDGPPYYYKVAYEEAERFLENLK